MAGTMKAMMIVFFVIPFTLHAQNAARFARALESGRVQAIDHWMKRELKAQKKGVLINNGSTAYTVHHPTYDSLVSFLMEQPGLLDAAWDRCQTKPAIWPGHSTVGLRFMLNGKLHERCYNLQEGIPGTPDFFFFWAHVRKDRDHFKFLRALACPGFIEQQRKICEGAYP